MIPALLIWLNRKYGKRVGQYLSQKRFLLFSPLRRALVPALIVLLLLLTALIAKSQEKKWQYKIIRNDDEIGTVKVSMAQDSTHCSVKVVSDIRFRMLFRFSAYVVEETMFSNNIMQYSSIYRKWNGSEKINRQTRTAGSHYEVANFGKTIVVPYYPVQFHVLQLYYKEPLLVKKVYSENNQQFFELQKTGDHSYKLLLADGDYNQYFYEHGICTKVDIYHSFFTAHMVIQY